MPGLVANAEIYGTFVGETPAAGVVMARLASGTVLPLVRYDESTQTQRTDAPNVAYAGDVLFEQGIVTLGINTFRRDGASQTFVGVEFHDHLNATTAFFGMNYGDNTMRYNAVPNGWGHTFLTQSVARMQLDGTQSATQTPLIVNLNGTMRRMIVKAGNALGAGDLVCVLA